MRAEAEPQIPDRVRLNCQRPAVLFGRSYRWIYQTPDTPLSLRGPLNIEPAVTAKSFVLNGPQ